MKKHALVCNLMYKHDTYAARGDLAGLLKYIQHRDDRDRYIPQMDGLERWMDRGLGDNYRAIASSLTRIATDKTNRDEVLVRMMVVSPHPDLMNAIPPERRSAALRELTETMMERYFEACDLPVPEFSYVIHDPQTETGIQRLHSHVLFPATVPDMEGRRHYDLRREQMPVFHQVRDGAITEVWTRLLGRERLAELDAGLLTEAEKQRAVEPQRELDDMQRRFDLDR
jgi:hypothetical protein